MHNTDGEFELKHGNYKKGVIKSLEINSNKKTTTKSEMKNPFDYITVFPRK